MGHIRYKIFDDVHVRKGVDFDRCTGLLVDTFQASQGIDAVNVHGTATADSFSTAPSEGQGGVEFVFDLDQRIEDHRPAFLQVDRVRLQARFLTRLVRVPAIDRELLGFRGRGRLFAGMLFSRSGKGRRIAG